MRHLGQKSRSTAQGYIAESVKKRRKVNSLIANSIDRNLSVTSVPCSSRNLEKSVENSLDSHFSTNNDSFIDNVGFDNQSINVPAFQGSSHSKTQNNSLRVTQSSTSFNDSNFVRPRQLSSPIPTSRPPIVYPQLPISFEKPNSLPESNIDKYLHFFRVGFEWVGL